MTPRLDAIGIVTSDLARSLQFYGRLGLDVPTDVADQPHVEVALPGGLRLMFDTEDTIRSFDSSWSPPADGGHRLALAFACDSPADVDRVVAELEAAGTKVHLPPFDAVWGQRYATVADPDGNHVDVFADLAR